MGFCHGFTQPHLPTSRQQSFLSSKYDKICLKIGLKERSLHSEAAKPILCSIDAEASRIICCAYKSLILLLFNHLFSSC